MKVEYKPFIWSIAVLLIVSVTGIVYRNHKISAQEENESARIAALNKKAAVESSDTIQLPKLQDGILDIGVVVVKDDQVVTFKDLKPGEKLSFGYTRDVAIRKYVNGQYSHTVPIGKNDEYLNTDMKSLGIQVEPGQGEVTAAFIKYRGTKPKTEDWYPLAFAAKVVTR